MNEEMLNKLEAIHKSIHSIDKTLAVQAEQLTAHMARTTANEERIKMIEDRDHKMTTALLLALLGAVLAYLFKR